MSQATEDGVVARFARGVAVFSSAPFVAGLLTLYRAMNATGEPNGGLAFVLLSSSSTAFFVMSLAMLAFSVHLREYVVE